MIPTDTTETRESWVCRACSSPNAGWRLRCQGCGVLVGGSPSTWAPPPPPVPAPTRKQGAATTALLVVGCIAIAVVLLGAAVVGIAVYQNATERREAEERVDDYVDGEGEVETEFFAADSQFRATFPAVPERSTDVTDVDGLALEFTFYTADLRWEAFSVATINLPPGSSFDLNMAANSAAASVNGQVEYASPTTWQGFDAIEASLSEPGGLTIKMLVVLTPRRVYMLQVAGLDDPSAEYETFKASFQIVL